MSKSAFRILSAGLVLAATLIFMQVVASPARAASGALQAATAVPSATPALTSTPMPPANPPVEASDHSAYGNCMMCHGNPNFDGVFENHESISLYVDPNDFAMSVHADAGLKCEACHASFNAYPHAGNRQVNCLECHTDAGGGMSAKYVPLVVELPYASKRAMALDINDKCATCHEEEYKSTSGSAHEKVFESGNTAAPTCVDCHGGHNTIKPGAPRTTIVEICGKCHESVYTSYKVSVHGSTLMNDPGNADVPTCINCHGVHSVRGPREVTFRGDSIVTCGGCHGDRIMMEKYDISTEVFDTYLDDYHGRTVSLFQEAGKTSSNKATCYDCHGIHNIRRPEDSLSSVYPDNLLHTCQQCHTDASIRFPAAWLSHTEITMEKTPALYFTKIAYAVFLIPGTIGAFALYILLDARRRWLDKRSAVLHAIAEEDSDEYEFEK